MHTALHVTLVRASCITQCLLRLGFGCCLICWCFRLLLLPLVVVRCRQLLRCPDALTMHGIQVQADICQLGLDQRKVNVLAREYCDQCKPKRKLKPVILSHEMMPGLLQVSTWKHHNDQQADFAPGLQRPTETPTIEQNVSHAGAAPQRLKAGMKMFLPSE